MTPICNLSTTESSLYWETFKRTIGDHDDVCENHYPTIHREDSERYHASDHHDSSSSSSLTRMLDIIEYAEELTISSPSDIFEEEDLEPTPIGPNYHVARNLLLLTPRSSDETLKEGAIHDDCCFQFKRKKQQEEHLLSPSRVIPSLDVVQSSASWVLLPSNFDSTKENINPERFRRYQSNQWMDRFENFVDFKSENGHCLVPHSFPPNKPLAQWVKRQRYQHKLKMLGRRSTLTDERQKELDLMGFVWDSHKAAWDECLEDLKKYWYTFGNCSVPTNFAGNHSLAVWVKCQRRQNKLFRLGKQSTMTQERFEKLDQLGFEWNPRNL